MARVSFVTSATDGLSVSHAPGSVSQCVDTRLPVQVQSVAPVLPTADRVTELHPFSVCASE